jgi:hypothetical protein
MGCAMAEIYLLELDLECTENPKRKTGKAFYITRITISFLMIDHDFNTP